VLQQPETQAVNVLDLMKPLQGNCLERNQGWWAYKVCFDQGVTQFHEEQKQVLTEFSLGNLLQPYEDDPNQMVVKHGHLSQMFHGGTLCDLTGHPRKVEVRYHCSLESLDHIESIKETATCQYLIMVASPRLCSHPAFGSHQKSTMFPIRCRTLVSNEEFRELVQGLNERLFSKAPARKTAIEELEAVWRAAGVGTSGLSSGIAGGSGANIQLGGDWDKLKTVVSKAVKNPDNVKAILEQVAEALKERLEGGVTDEETVIVLPGVGGDNEDGIALELEVDAATLLHTLHEIVEERSSRDERKEPEVNERQDNQEAKETLEGEKAGGKQEKEETREKQPEEKERKENGRGEGRL